MQRKVTVILAADVVGFSRLVAEDEEESLRRLMSYREVFDEFVEQHGGRIFNTAGDAVLAEFRSSVEAVRAAIDIQETLRMRNFAYPPSRHMQFRIGITVGDVIERDGDLLGDAVNLAARLQGLAVPGGVWISRSVHEQVAGKLSLSFRDLGAQSVKNIPTPVHVYAVMPDEAGGVTAVPVKTETAPAAPAPVPPRGLRRWPIFAAVAGAVAVLVAVLMAAGWYAIDGRPGGTGPDRVADGAPVSQAGPAQAAGDLPFVAEQIPFLREDNRNDIKDGYVGARGDKALALNRYGYGFVVAEPDLETARRKALDSCRQSTGEACEIYAEGDELVWPHPLPPLPPEPWLRGVPGEAMPFDPERVPFVREADEELIASFAGRPLPRALSVNDDGYIGMSWGGAAAQDPIRRSLEYCGDRSGSACLLVAVDETFVVGLPESYAITGLFRPKTDDAFTPQQRADLAGLYAGSDWRAVAVGSGGYGVTVGRASEAEAVAAAMADCARTGEQCRVHAINAFRVARRD
ncbi:adenylate/guanylate cyclase domain-containing protein [Microbaculum marinum]|uniref:Adenylate/guanylate cyclase domain-containing protein n=1 Tax=Microbaculum marinum TaxID=1764581 RepID=A0AAW9RV94_9HYPH